MQFINVEEEGLIENFNSELKNAYINEIPVFIRKILLEDLKCRPLELKHKEDSTNPIHIRWEYDGLGVIFFYKFNSEEVEIHILPTPSKKTVSENNSWYNIENLNTVLADHLSDEVIDKGSLNERIKYYEKPDKSQCCLKIQNLTWKEAEFVIPVITNWSKENQQKTILPDEIIECLKMLECTPQYTRRENNSIIPCKHKSGKLLVWILNPNINGDSYGLRTPDISRELEWYEAGAFRDLLPADIEFERREKGRWASLNKLSKKDVVTCLPVIINWMLQNNIVDLKSNILEGDFKMSKTEELAKLLEKTHNLILHGAPGTGKTYLAREIAKEMGCPKNQIGFVQFHPSYDYTDFVEGIRPVTSSDGITNRFERRDGVFKEFCKKVIEENSIEAKRNKILKLIEDYFSNGKKNIVCDRYDYSVSLSDNEIKMNGPFSFNFTENINVLLDYCFSQKDVLLSDEKKCQKIIFETIYEELKIKIKKIKEEDIKTETQHPSIFIIDEINRGDLSKILGELFFTIDPGYRGPSGRIKTQYQNLVTEDDIFAEGFYIPENVYIIGTMNDIDRSVESMDLAMRRRFTFKEVMAKDTRDTILSCLNEETKKEAICRMDRLNNSISKMEGLSSAYHIGGAYFLKLSELDNDFELLWEYHLKGLLREYLRGNGDIEMKIAQLKNAYDSENNIDEDN